MTRYNRLHIDCVPDEHGCLVWPYQLNRTGSGYGQVTISGRKEYVHRVAWELTNGPIPAGLQVLHRCDNPPCFEPDHLFLGTQADNIRDALAKGRLDTTTGAEASKVKWRQRVAAGVPTKYGRFPCGHAMGQRGRCRRGCEAGFRDLVPEWRKRLTAKDLTGALR